MARLPVVDGDDGAWGAILNEFLEVAHDTDGTLKTVAVNKGGTGATDATTARTNLGLGNAATRNIGTTNGTAAAGDDARFVPTGGTTGQVLSKNSNTNHDVEWVDQSGSGATEVYVWDPTTTNYVEGGRVFYGPADPSTEGYTNTTGTAWIDSDESGTAPTYVWYETYTWAIGGEIKVPSGDTDFIIPKTIRLRSNQTAKMVEATYKINSGTSVTAKIQRGGADATGFTGLSVTTTETSTNPTDITLADGDAIGPVVTAVAGTPKNMQFTIVVEHTVSAVV